MKDSLYKVTVRKGLGPGNWKDFSKVIFEVSLDNKRYKGESLYAILNWAQPRFESIHIIICDTLQRHNICFNQKISEPEAQITATKMGDQWLCDSQSYFQELGIRPEITRWDDWRNYDPMLYKKHENNLKTLYEKDPIIQKEINSISNTVWERRKKKDNLDNMLETSFKNQVILPYFFEETALSAVFLPKIKGISAYPGSLPQFWNNFIDGKMNILSGFKDHTFVNLDLKRKP